MERSAPPLLVDVSGDVTPPERPRSRFRRPRPTWALAVLIVGVVVALALWRFADSPTAPVSRAEVDKAVQQGIARAQDKQRNTPPDAAVAYRAILPSLVTITTEPAAPGRTSPGRTSLGSGVVINAEGAVLTALHVVEDGGPITVRFADGTQASARVASRQADSDIAVLAVDRLPGVVVPAVMGGEPQVGDAVFPVGNPLGLQGTLTAGVVSATARSVRAENGRTLQRLIQFDAAVNPGNSGGPLLDRAGQVIGIVTGLANPSEQAFFVGIGFAVPIATAGGVAGGPQR
ncbi:MAG: trypsin-like peptidase domain-containing protein [Kineosporiaceae bacterium]